jgi:hypothetical protein
MKGKMQGASHMHGKSAFLRGEGHPFIRYFGSLILRINTTQEKGFNNRAAPQPGPNAGVSFQEREF